MGVCQIRTKAGTVYLKSVDRSILIGIDITALIGLEVVSKPHLRPNGCVAGLR
jgi:hypothetical protein